MRWGTALRGSLAGFVRDEAGNATMEMVIILPVFFYFVFSLAEAGTLMARTVMLDRGVDIAMRDVRLGLAPGTTHEDIKASICEAAFLLIGCEEALMLEITPIADVTTFPNTAVQCVDRTSEVEPVVTFVPGARSEIVLVRACLIVNPLFPGMGIGAMLPKDASGGYAILSSTAFMNEPS